MTCTYDITYNENNYPVREISIHEFGDILVSTTKLERELLDYSTCSYNSDTARWIDAQICYYVEPECIAIAENELVQLLESELC